MAGEDRNQPQNMIDRYEQYFKEGEPTGLLLRLFVAGNTPRSQTTIQILRQLFDQQLQGRYQLEVIDIYQQPELAREENIIATPTLIKDSPLPQKRLVGDFTQIERVLACLGIRRPNGKQ